MKAKTKLLSMLLAGTVSVGAQASLDEALESELFETDVAIEESLELESMMHSPLGKPGQSLRHGKLSKRKAMLEYRQRKRLRMLKKRSHRICKKAGLDYQGKVAFRQKMKAQKLDTLPLRKELKKARKEFVAATLEANANVAAIEEAAVKLAAARAELIASNKAFVGITVTDLFEGGDKKKGLRCVASKMKIQKVKKKMMKKKKRLAKKKAKGMVI